MVHSAERARSPSRRPERRRLRPKTLWLALSGRGRRSHLRRAEDRARGGTYLDRYSLSDGLWVLSAVLLCVGDAWFTLVLLSVGGEELNPLMVRLLREGAAHFFWTKFLLTSVGLLTLLLHREFTLFGGVRGAHLLYAVTLAYVGLVAYELHLLSIVLPFSG